jgi:hypothetical protein
MKNIVLDIKYVLRITRNRSRRVILQNKSKIRREVNIIRNGSRRVILQNKSKIRREVNIIRNGSRRVILQNKSKIRREVNIIRNGSRRVILQNKNKIKREVNMIRNKSKRVLLQNKNKIKREVNMIRNKSKKVLLQNKNKIKRVLLQNKNKIKRVLLQNKNKIKREVNIIKNKIRKRTNLLINNIKLKFTNFKNEKEVRKYKKEESSFLKKIQNESKQTLCFINSPKTQYFDIDNNFKKVLFDKKVAIFFRYSILKQSWLESSTCWDSKNVKHFNHIGREIDSDEYNFCQNYVNDLLENLKLSNNKLDKIFEYMKTSVVLQSSESYVTLLRYLNLISETSEQQNLKNILIVGSDLHFSFSLSFLLNNLGYKTFVLKSENINIKKYLEVKNIFLTNNYKSIFNIPKSNIDIKIEINRLNNLKKKNKKSIFVPIRINDNLYFHMMLSLVKRIKDYNFIIIDRFDDEKTMNKLKMQDLPDNYIYHSLSSKFLFLNDEDKKDLTKDLFEHFKTKSLTQKFGNLILDNNFLIYGLNTIKNQIIRALFYYKIYEEVFKSYKPQAILASPSRTVEARGAIEAGNKNKIPTFDLQGGTIVASNRYWASNAKYMLCTEKFSYGIYKDFFSLKKENIFLVGSPRLDNDMEVYKKRRELKKDKIKILIALQTLSSEINTKIVKTCEDAILGFNNVELYISFHPADSISNRKLVLERKKSSTKVSDKKTLEELIDTNICITYFSTIGLEAFALGCDVIALNVIDKENWIFRLSDIGVAKEAYSSEELRELILLNDKIEDRDDFKILRDGKSAERILNLIETLK